MLFSCVMKLVDGFFCFSENFLKVNIFSAFFVSVCIEDSIFCLVPSLPTHLGNSIELTEFCRFIPSSTRFNTRLVSGVGIDPVRTESVTIRPSCTGLPFLEPWIMFPYPLVAGHILSHLHQ